MALTKKVTVFYEVTQQQVRPAEPEAIQRKEEWVDAVQKTIEADWKPRIIRVTYELFNPEVEQQRKFFNGPVVAYYAIQNEDLLTGTPGTTMLNRYREQLLDDTLGYDVELVKGKVRRRKSTADFIETQKWSNLLDTLKETHFDPSGYEFPNEKDFWELAKVHGYKQAHRISLEQLQRRHAAKLS